MSKTQLKVVIVGAGFGGIGMAVALRAAGINDFIILEKGDEVGGVWRENTYPGCCCDVPSHLYSFSFEPYQSNRTRYPDQKDILAYLRDVTAKYGLLPHLRLRTAVREARYVAEESRWRIRTDADQEIIADIVVFAVGQLDRPNIPEIPGRELFSGPAFHAARWDHTETLTGKHVAVIGTGSSSAQMLPTLADQAASVRVFQRTPHWVLPKPHTDFGPLTSLALRIPGAHQLYRHALADGADALLAPVMHRGWSARPAQWLARRYLRHSIADPQLREQITPHYPIGGKRIIFDSHYYSTLNKTNVQLISDPIEQITSTGIETASGVEYPVDLIVYATGFRASEFLVPVAVYGPQEEALNEQWRDGASAFAGLAIPGFPNAFLIAGPNTFNPAGSNPAMKEVQIDYIIRCLRWREQVGAAAIEVDPRVVADYQRWLEDAVQDTVWSTTGSWYQHHNGRVTNPWPATARTFARLLQHPPEAAFMVRTSQSTLPLASV